MHLSVATLCVAIASCRVGIGSRAAPSGNTSQSPRLQLEVTTKRQLSSNKLAPNEEERVGPSEEEVLNYMQELKKALAGEPASMEKETEQFNLLNEREQLVKSVASEEEEKQLELQKAWEQYSKSLAIELKKTSTEELKALLKAQRDALKGAKSAHFKEVLEGSKWPVEMTQSEAKSSTTRLEHWHKAKESPARLFEVLGIYKAVDKAANSLLFTYNLGRWKAITKYYFPQRLQDTLKTYFEDPNQAELFVNRMDTLVQKTDPTVLKLLQERKSPEDAFKSLKLNRNMLFEKKISKWLDYVEAFNDVYPASAKPLLTILEYTEDELVKMLFSGLSEKPRKGTQGTPRIRVLNELLQSWAGSNPPVSASDAYIQLGLKTDEGIQFNSARFAAWMSYIDLISVGKPQENVSYMSTLVSLYDTKYLVETFLEETRSDRLNMLAKDLISHLEKEKAELPFGPEKDDLLNRLKDRNKKEPKPSKRKPESPLEAPRRRIHGV